ncbi:MAG TPA: phosphatase PAP2 family protein [Prosthecobacter sp.]|nr:phosphatase PAP2 family protein [Prosthecobacter sp.]
MIRDFVLFLFRRVGNWRKEPLIPALLLVVACGLWGFIEIAEEVQGRETHDYDRMILLAMREKGDPADPLGPPWMEEMGRDVTALGGFTVLTGLTAAAIGFMVLVGRPRLALLTLVAVVGGMLVSGVLKEFFSRPRPDVVPHGMLVTSASFPSGHTTMAAVVYLTLGVLVARAFTKLKLRLYIIALSLIVALCVGISRVYLGVHWPTDVLAGWTLGGMWALVFGLIALRVTRSPAQAPNGEGGEVGAGEGEGEG